MLSPEELRQKHFATICVHGSGGVDQMTGAIAPPIYQSSTFAFRSAQEGAEIFAGTREGYVYTRLGNPTQSALEREMAFLECGETALALASGMAAISTAILSIVSPRETIVSSRTLYGGTHKLFKELFPRLGLEVIDVDGTNTANIAQAMRQDTRLVYIETPSNPTLTIIDIAECAAIAHAHNALLMVDNTFATPYYQRPIEMGADIVMHSATKYIGGHGDTIGGILVGKKGLLDKVRGEVLRDIGCCISPINAWLLLRGLKTLPVRMERHSFNATRIAKYLSFHPKVARVWYPGLTTHPQHELAKKQMSGFGGMVTFELKGGRRAGEILMNSVRLMTLAVSLGDVDTLIEHPATMTHSTYSAEDLEGVGISEGLVRLSVGIEDVNDLIDDMSQALRKIC